MDKYILGTAASFDVVPCYIRGNGGTNVFHYCLDPVPSYPISHCTEGEDSIFCLYEKFDEKFNATEKYINMQSLANIHSHESESHSSSEQGNL